MKRLFFAATAAVCTFSATAADLDEVLSCNYETLGGLDNIKAVESARMTGTMTMGPMQAPFTIEFQQPNRVRLEFEVQGMTAVQAYDGETGWAIMPFMGKTTPEKMADDQLKSIQEMAEWEGPLVNWQEKGHSVELVGTEEVEGTEAYALKVVRAGSEDEVTMFLDTDYCLPFLSKGVRDIQGNEMAFSQTIGDYKEVGDIVMAHSMIANIGDGPTPMQQAITIETAELNVSDLKSDRFAMPEVEQPAAAAE
ncbi:MAG: hypothetical protein QNJ40_07785 [Xanthomonadales bacterium]|nr:hypothetical protein [Xanthomonadales bacterium]